MAKTTFDAAAERFEAACAATRAAENELCHQLAHMPPSARARVSQCLARLTEPFSLLCAADCDAGTNVVGYAEALLLGWRDFVRDPDGLCNTWLATCPACLREEEREDTLWKD